MLREAEQSRWCVHQLPALLCLPLLCSALLHYDLPCSTLAYPITLSCAALYRTYCPELTSPCLTLLSIRALPSDMASAYFCQSVSNQLRVESYIWGIPQICCSMVNKFAKNFHIHVSKLFRVSHWKTPTQKHRKLFKDVTLKQISAPWLVQSFILEVSKVSSNSV